MGGDPNFYHSYIRRHSFSCVYTSQVRQMILDTSFIVLFFLSSENVPGFGTERWGEGEGNITRMGVVPCHNRSPGNKVPANTLHPSIFGPKSWSSGRNHINSQKVLVCKGYD